MKTIIYAALLILSTVSCKLKTEEECKKEANERLKNKIEQIQRLFPNGEIHKYENKYNKFWVKIDSINIKNIEFDAYDVIEKVY